MYKTENRLLVKKNNGTQKIPVPLSFKGGLYEIVDVFTLQWNYNKLLCSFCDTFLKVNEIKVLS